MLRALGEYHIGGIRTNIPLFRTILNDPAFRHADLHTGYLDALLKTGLDLNPPPAPELAPIAAAVAQTAVPPSSAPMPSSSSSNWLTAGRAELLR
jgi:acetyl-CoA carboxylase, biotin carboxylase subunit